MGQPQIVHPEIELLTSENGLAPGWEPVYPSTEKLKAKGLNGRSIGKLTANLLQQLRASDITENLPESLLKTKKFGDK